MSMDGSPPASGSYAAAESPSLIGQVLDNRYKLVAKLGEGGMGEVYAAEHVHIEKRYAIKLLRTEIVSNPEAVIRFRQEARSSSSIGHRNIIAIEDFGTLSDGRIYMCMELLNGAPLNDLIKQPLPMDRLLNIVIQTGHGLAAAHAKGIVHRDMKPENIFVTVGPSGEDVPKILDFGIAKVSGNDGQNHLTRTGTIFGTPFYMAPEQALGNSVNERTDLYAMGVILYELFAGSLPFQGESFMGILTQHITTEAEPVAQRAAKAGRTLPPGLAEVITRCMQKDPARRYASMDELVAVLIPIYRSIAGPGMSTYMEAFPVNSAAHPAMTPGPMSVPMKVPTGQVTGPVPGHTTGQVGSAPGASGLFDPSASVVDVPKKSKTGLIIAIVALLAVGGGVAAVVLLGDGGTGGGAAGSGSAVATNGANGSGGAAVGSGGPAIGSAGSGVTSANGGGATAAGTVDAGGAPASGSNASVDAPAAAPVDAAAAVDPVGEPKEVNVLIVATNATKFEMWESGEKVGDGPDELPVPLGEAHTVVIKARGFKDKPVDIDGSKTRIEITLERVGGGVKDPNPNGAGKDPILKDPYGKLPKDPTVKDPTPHAGNDCSKTLVNGNDAKCVRQYCATHPGAAIGADFCPE
jgi:serine/threonine-protein kinase